MALGCSVAGPLVKSVSPITRGSVVVSTITKLSEETERRLTASAGYDSFVQVHLPISRGAPSPLAAGSSLSLGLERRLSASHEDGVRALLKCTRPCSARTDNTS